MKSSCQPPDAGQLGDIEPGPLGQCVAEPGHARLDERPRNGESGTRGRSAQPLPARVSVTAHVLPRGPDDLASHGRLTDGSAPDLPSRYVYAGQRHMARPGGQRSVKPSAQPTLVRTQHLPLCFRRSKPVTPDGGAGFCVPLRAVRGPSVGQLWARQDNGPWF
jgi:hypothetical protein